ncbi:MULTISPECIES: hypothetical protein [Vibrio]|uniref:hypothetical protein n=1 Tax=Vibrio TaxID=662 RepID=UPI00069BBDFC|nr:MULTISPECIES: hypothetical protein [Vibrio]MCK8081419.1 hypothetical protein [Vibrio sp. 1CM24A]
MKRIVIIVAVILQGCASINFIGDDQRPTEVSQGEVLESVRDQNDELINYAGGIEYHVSEDTSVSFEVGGELNTEYPDLDLDSTAVKLKVMF